MLLGVPETHRHGKVFRLVGVAEGKGGSQVAQVQAADWVSRMVCRIGKAAGIVVNETTKRNPKTGGTRKVVKYASCHDLRRAFGFRWSRRIMPAELRELMRHADISTTMAFYVGKSAESTAGALWSAYEAESPENGNTLGNSSPNEAETETQETPKTPEKQGLSDSTPRGVERTPKPSGKTALSEIGGATVGAVIAPPAPIDPDLQRIIGAWPTLSEATRRRILTMVDAPREN